MKIHLDTDFGGDIDDLCALALMLALPDLEITGITTVADEGGRRCGYVRYVLELAGRTDIPVAAGVDVSLGSYRWRPGYYDEAAYWPEPVARSPNPLQKGLDLLESSIQKGATIVGIGPFTNLAVYDYLRPRRLATVPLFLMGYYVHGIPAGFPQWGIDTDWNVQSDVFAARRMIEALHSTIIPCEVTLQTSLRRAYLGGLRQSGPVGALLARQCDAFTIDEQNEEKIGKVCAGLPTDTINFLHDPLAVAVALGWTGVTTESIPLQSQIEGDGYLRAGIAPSGRPTKVVTQVDGPAFGDWWYEALTKGLPR